MDIPANFIAEAVASALVELGVQKRVRKSKKSRCMEKFGMLRIQIDLYIDHGHKDRVLRLLDELESTLGICSSRAGAARGNTPMKGSG